MNWNSISKAHTKNAAFGRLFFCAGFFFRVSVAIGAGLCYTENRSNTLQTELLMMKKEKTIRWKRIAVSFLAVLAICVLLFAVVFFWHYPHYCARRQAISIPPSDTGTIRIMSYNLRCLTPLDLGEKSWYYRADLIASDLEEQKPGIIGFQEATVWQYEYMVDTLTDYDSVITYRDDSLIAEGCPIFYHTAMYTLVDKGSFWLSETPEVMSKDWGAAHHRICSYVILKDNHSGNDFVVFNTHLDHVSDEARIKGMQVILEKIDIFGDLPAVLMGDMNALEGSATYNNAVQHFLDARYEAIETMGGNTYQGWGDLQAGKRIDYFMLSKTSFSVNRYAVLPALHDGVYSSDHSPILLEISLIP
jgi:endonuclease/exonuclease/phosphatase family metal-dependent hydrolase